MTNHYYTLAEGILNWSCCSSEWTRGRSAMSPKPRELWRRIVIPARERGYPDATCALSVLSTITILLVLPGEKVLSKHTSGFWKKTRGKCKIIKGLNEVSPWSEILSEIPHFIQCVKTHPALHMAPSVLILFKIMCSSHILTAKGNWSGILKILSISSPAQKQQNI